MIGAMFFDLRLTRLLACLALLWMFSQAALARADEAFKVESANTQLDESVYFFNAVFAVGLPDYIVRAVEQGFDLPLVLEIEVHRERNLWFDERVIYIRQQYRLSYHSLLDEYSLLNVNAGMRSYFSSLEKAIAHLSVILQYPAVDRNALMAAESYSIRCRIGVDDSHIPLPLKSSSLWKNDWDLRSEWFEWQLQP